MSSNDQREGRANSRMSASDGLTVPPDFIDEIRLNYRLAKSAESARIVIDQKLASFARVYLTAWTPSGEQIEREKANRQAMRVITAIRKGTKPKDEDAELAKAMRPMVLGMEPSREIFESERKIRRNYVVDSVLHEIPAWQVLECIKGFGAWGLGVLIGEAGDIGKYPGCRHLFKRFGLAPNECYPRGEKSTGRMIPRSTRGRVVGIIADPLLKAKAKNAYGKVYDSNKTRHLEAGKTKGHAHALARRAMVKALIHDAHRAWHGQPLDYVFTRDEASHQGDGSRMASDRPSLTSEVHAA